MSLFQCSFYSHNLRTITKVNVCLPEYSSGQVAAMTLEECYAPRKPFPVLYLLHGMNGDETVWLRRTNVERYAGHLGMALVLPYGENNYYTDNAHGLKWFTYLTQELPLFVRAHFPVSTRRQDTFIAGLSMGGYGACKAALRCPEQYAAFASLSGALDVETIAREYNVNSYWEGLGDCIFHTGQPIGGSEEDVYALTRRLSASGVRRPPAYLCCGTEDVECMPMSRKLLEVMEECGYPHTWEEGPGAHEWDFWETYIRRALDFFVSLPQEDR